MDWILETPRLGLRALTEADFSHWHAMLSDPETMQHYPKPFDETKTRQWIAWNIENYATYGFGLWAVILKETGEFVGDCGITMQDIHGDGRLFPEIGFHIDKRFWRHGYASEAARECLRYAFEHLHMTEVYCYQKWTNVPSRKTAEKLGMRLREEYGNAKNTFTSVYSITREEYSDGTSADNKTS